MNFNRDNRLLIGFAIVAMAGFLFMGCYSKKFTKKIVYDAYTLGWAQGYADCSKRKKICADDKNITMR